MRDESALSKSGLLSHDASPHDIVPIVRLQRCVLKYALLPLRGQIVDVTASILDLVDLNTAVPMSSDSLLVLTFLVSELLV